MSSMYLYGGSPPACIVLNSNVSPILPRPLPIPVPVFTMFISAVLIVLHLVVYDVEQVLRLC